MKTKVELMAMDYVYAVKYNGMTHTVYEQWDKTTGNTVFEVFNPISDKTIGGELKKQIVTAITEAKKKKGQIIK